MENIAAATLHRTGGGLIEWPSCSCVPMAGTMATRLASLTAASVEQARNRIGTTVYRTPVITSSALSRSVQSSLAKFRPRGQDHDVQLVFKCENLQKGGAFKFRGALHCLMKLTETNADLSSGLVTYSTGETSPTYLVLYTFSLPKDAGNHARALEIAAQLVSQETKSPIPVSVVMSRNSPIGKFEALRRLGINIVTTGNSPEDREEKAAEIQKTTEALLIPPSDNPDIALGQGTAILEIEEQVKEAFGGGGLDGVIMPSGSGGLLSGAAIVGSGSRFRVYGAELEERSLSWAGACMGKTSREHLQLDGGRRASRPGWTELLRAPTREGIRRRGLHRDREADPRSGAPGGHRAQDGGRAQRSGRARRRVARPWLPPMFGQKSGRPQEDRRCSHRRKHLGEGALADHRRSWECDRRTRPRKHARLGLRVGNLMVSWFHTECSIRN